MPGVYGFREKSYGHRERKAILGKPGKQVWDPELLGEHWHSNQILPCNKYLLNISLLGS